MNRTHLSIPDLVPGYALVGYSKRAAVGEIVAGRLGCKNARGKGNNAAKRAAVLAEHTAREIEELQRRMRERLEAQSRAWWAAYRAEWKGEARSVSHHYAMCVHE